MVAAAADSPVIAVSDLESFFIGSVQSVMQHQRLRADPVVTSYLGRLLAEFARAEHLYEHTAEGVLRRPLMDHYRRALEAGSLAQRRVALQRLGDVALFVTGILPDSLQRSLVDVDYYVAMGASAYGCLSDLREHDTRGRVRGNLFAALSQRFVQFVDVLEEVVEHAPAALNRDALRLYERWRRTGSQRLHRHLLALGVTPRPLGAAH
jgi:hypothetical protein